MTRTDEPFALVILGASGDLTRRKLVPALWSLYAGRTLPEPFAIIGSARSEASADEFRRRMRATVREFARVKPPSENVWDRFASALSYVPGDPADPALYAKLEAALREIEGARPGPANRLFYCATPPSLYETIIGNLGASGLAHPQGGWTRIIVEKPFGRDHESARALNSQLGAVFREEQIYRIDHYLGKETVQNLLVLRFANTIFEPLWNRNHVAEVQITVAEALGVETRGAYYEEAGALRDMMQNHLLQLLCLLAMEPPVTFDAGPVHDEKNKVMHAIRPIDPRKIDEVALRGQCGPGFVEGKAVVGYRWEKGVAPDSRTETYAALRLDVDNWRWAGVPFYLRTGKRLPARVTEVALQFQRPPHLPIAAGQASELDADALVLRIQPDEGITLRFGAKVPGHSFRVRTASMQFSYGESFPEESPEAYERLLLDALVGDPTLFIRSDEVRQCWRIIDPVIGHWATDGKRIPTYEAGSWGPD